MTIGIRERQSASTKLYEKFITDDFSQIRDQLTNKGYMINSAGDFSTYVGWRKKGRRVKRGEKGLTITSSKRYSQPHFYYNRPVMDEKTGRQVFYMKTKTYTLFALEQTEIDTLF